MLKNSSNWKTLRKSTSKIVTTDYLLKRIFSYCKIYYAEKNQASFHGIDVYKSTYVKEVIKHSKISFINKNDLWKLKQISGLLPPASKSKGIIYIRWK